MNDNLVERAAEVVTLDRAVYQTVADTPTPALDIPLRRLSRAGNYSSLWLGLAGLLALAGGDRGREVAGKAVAAIAINSFVVNVVAKRLRRRSRPDRDDDSESAIRHVSMPTSSSFPSGHAASGFAFATVVSYDLPALGLASQFLAGATAYSRVHTGVHYPLDTLVGSFIGATVGSAVVSAADRLRR